MLTAPPERMGGAHVGPPLPDQITRSTAVGEAHHLTVEYCRDEIPSGELFGSNDSLIHTPS